MKPHILAFLALAACGGGGSAPADAQVVVAYAPCAPGHVGECDWTGDVVRIRIDPYYAQKDPFFPGGDSFFAGYRDAILRHELWHALTRIEEHSTDEHCISFSPAPGDLWQPCAAEKIQVIESSFPPLRVSFPEDPTCLERATEWWNEACGEVLEVVP